MATIRNYLRLNRTANQLLVRNNLGLRRGQNVLIGLMVAVSSLLFSVAISVLSSLDQPFEHMYANAKASHIVMIIDTDIYDSSTLRNWWQGQVETTNTIEYDIAYSENFLPYFKGKRLATMVSYAEYQVQNKQDILHFLASSPKESTSNPSAPAAGEVWLPSSLATQNGITIGDTLSIPVYDGSFDLTVSAIVVDPQFSSGYVNPTRIWLAPGQLSVLFPPESLHYAMLGLRLNDPSQINVTLNRFSEFLGGAFNGSLFEYSQIRFGFTWLLRMIGTAMLVFSILAGLACLMMVHSTITSAVRNDQRQIGILKSMGFTPPMIQGIYVHQYSLISFIALIPGSILSFFLSKAMLGSLAIALGVDLSSGLSLLLPLALVFPVFLGLVASAAWWTSRQAGRMSAVQAIRQENPGTKHKPARIAFPALFRTAMPTVALLAVRNLGQQPKRALVSLFAMAFAAFLLLTANSTINLFASVSQNLGYWGFIDSDVSILRNGRRFKIEHQDMMQFLGQNSNVQAIVAQDNLDASLASSDGTQVMTIYGNAFDNDPSIINQVNLSGRHPLNSQEISLGSNTALIYQKKLGDLLTLHIYGQALDFRVVGIFQSVGNLGHGFRITGDGFRRANPAWQPTHYELILKPKGDRQALTKDLESRYGEAVEIQDMRDRIRQVTNGMVQGVSSAFILMVVIFLGLGAVNIASASAMEINETIRNLALYKTIGYTPRQLRLAMALKFGLIGLLGAILGAILNLILEPPMIIAAMGALGVVSYEQVVAWEFPLIIVVCALFAALSTIVPSRRLGAIKTRTLLVE